MDEIMRHSDIEQDSKLDTKGNKPAVFQPYDPWEVRFGEDKRRTGTAEGERSSEVL
jgi:hypothetical protein